MENIFSNKKILTILGLFCIVAVVICVVYFNFFDISDLVLLDESAEISFAAQYDGDTAVIDSNGNCYARTTSPYGSIGIKDTKQYRRLFNIGKENSFVQIYDGGDAKKIFLFGYGGAIITQSDDLFVFSNNLTDYLTPKYVCEDVQQASVFENRLFLINKENEFGYYMFPDFDEFTVLTENAKYFDIAEVGQELLVLTLDNRLLTVPISNVDNQKFTLCMQNVERVSFVQYNEIYPKTEIAILDTSGKVFVKSRTIDKQLKDILSDGEWKNVAASAKDISVYQGGVIVLFQDNSVGVYGKDLYGDNIYDNDNKKILSLNGKMICSSRSNVLVLNQDGTLACYGYLPNSDNVSFDTEQK